ncbi:alkaline phosphatase [Halieaceae bacterium IMCC14734]|uniref:Alkaline phosphatase n=1 Tax=Candidatus Litorirhabdus singularis TaxID=2518993 RepID=A0ABT3TD40_9GAMM|nr:alkaline phosphatase [Candidatus Litorirhabdus singularis]MCX2980218.1 alkaline phosphatase [Candidatus Litorirhabdus singularis]
MRTPTKTLTTAVSTLLLTAAATLSAQQPANVILIIGDGMDDHQITIARNYLVGSRGRLTLDQMPMRGVAQVLTVNESGQAVYVADSANSATSMATGEVTSRGRIATTAGSDQPIPTIIELAEAAGMKTGLVSTASVTDATPASFVAHINARFCENPEAMQDVEFSGIKIGDCTQHLAVNGGAGSISEQIARSNVDVVLGGGSKHFAVNSAGGSTSVSDLASANGYHVVTAAADMATAPADQKLLGLFSPGTMPVRLQGEGGREAEKPVPSWANHISRYIGSVTMPEPMICEPNPGFAGMPSMQSMTEIALARLRNDSGFFLMVESASIDKQSHERKPCGSIGELEQLNEVLDSALAFAESNPNTLIIVTADHGQAAQMIPEESLFAAFGAPVFTRGRLARIKTPEGTIMGVNYATNDFIMEEHTGVNIPVFSNQTGVGKIPTMITQPQIFELVREHLGL